MSGAPSWIETLRPDILLADITMPRLDGLALTRNEWPATSR